MTQTRAVIERVLESGTVVARSDGSTHSIFPVSIAPEEGEAIAAWVRRERAARTIEVGLGYGISALFLCGGLLATGRPGACHAAVDPHQATRFSNCGLQLIEDAGLREMVDFSPEGSETALPYLLHEGRHFDVAFVDGNHRFEGVFIDLMYLGWLVRGDGIVIVDDYQLRSVARAVSFCTTNLGWTTEEVGRAGEHHAWAALRTPPVAIERPFDHYVDF